MDIRVGIIDYGISNITSVFNAFLYLGCNVKIVSESKKLSDFTHLVLPGVGSFPKGMENLGIKGFDEASKNDVRAMASGEISPRKQHVPRCLSESCHDA